MNWFFKVHRNFQYGLVVLLMALSVISCRQPNLDEDILSSRDKLLEKINYYKVAKDVAKQNPYKYRLTYFFENGHPYRWVELDTNKLISTDYIYEYGTDWVHTGARYIEPGDEYYSREIVAYFSDSLEKKTTWVDSAGDPYYEMYEYLRPDGQPERAAFTGDELHGFDSTFYTADGFPSRIFFTNVRGTVFNDRSFTYDSVVNGDWVVRQKFMGDTLQEIHRKEVYFHGAKTANPFYEGIISLGDFDENAVSFSQDDQLLFFTRSLDWNKQVAYLASKKEGLFTELQEISELDTLYNGAISPSGDRIIFCRKQKDSLEIWLAMRRNSSWSQITNLSISSGIRGGYFNWLDEELIYFYVPDNSGDIVLGALSNDSLRIIKAMDAINTTAAEFSPFVAKDRSFIIFTRYLEGDPNQQGFFISLNTSTSDDPKWGEPRKINALPYGWGAFISPDQQYFFYTNGSDIYSHSLDELDI